MIIIADTNILFSACLTPDGRIFEILFSTSPHLNIVSSQFAIKELQKHREKLILLSKRSADEIDTLLGTILKQVNFFSEDIIRHEFWLEAHRLTVGVDSNDLNFVALTLQTAGILWTGDKKLVAHLAGMGFDQLINSTELYNKLEITD